jgi:hypothetical protein
MGDDLFAEEDMGGGDQSLAPPIGYKATDKDMFNPASAAARHGLVQPKEDVFPEYVNRAGRELENTAFNPFTSSEDVAPVENRGGATLFEKLSTGFKLPTAGTAEKHDSPKFN